MQGALLGSKKKSNVIKILSRLPVELYRERLSKNKFNNSETDEA
ncbi:hypothetical protein [Psychroserpens sp.]